MATDAPGPGAFAEADREWIDRILAYMLRATGVDFRCYRRSTVERRIRNRMISVDVRDADGYFQVLSADPAEPEHLLQRIAIKVSRFFRNRETYDALQSALPMLRDRAGGRPLRIWSAGCSHGEEAYSLAMLLEQAGIDGEIIATDIDPLALAAATSAVYPAEARASVGERLWERCFEPAGGAGFRPVAAVRRRVRFERHDLVGSERPPAGGPFDLICCRNVLIYIQRPTQLQVLTRLLEAIVPDGLLCLGEAEWPSPEVNRLLQPWPRKTRIFQFSSKELACVDSQT